MPERCRKLARSALPMALAVLAWVLLITPAVAAQVTPEASEPSSSARGILVVIGGAALLAAGMWFWLRDDGTDEDVDPDEDEASLPEPDEDEPYPDL